VVQWEVVRRLGSVGLARELVEGVGVGHLWTVEHGVVST
jgi:hypothetical protein